MGRMIVVDGLDGCGKSTQLERLREYLDASGTSYQQISFPDYAHPSSALVKLYLDGAFGSSPEDVNAYAASSFYAVDRYASYQLHWREAYEAGTLIVAARYTTSNAIHQMPKLPESEWDAYLSWMEDYEYRLLGLPRPDAVFFLDMPLDVARELVMRRYDGDGSKRDIHERDIQYLEQCRPAALYAARKLGWHVIPCGDGGKAFPVAAITHAIVEQIKGDVLFG